MLSPTRHVSFYFILPLSTIQEKKSDGGLWGEVCKLRRRKKDLLCVGGTYMFI